MSATGISPATIAPAYDAEDLALLATAAAHPDFLSLAELTPDALRDIATRQGVDFATALLYQRVRASRRHAPFIAAIESAPATPTVPLVSADTVIAIVPAAFYRQMPHAGADGHVVRETAIQLGLPCELVPLQSAGTLAENGRILRDWLVRHRERKIILVSLCKGGADVKHALQSGDATCFVPVIAWVNICGTLDGSPFAQWLLASKPRFIATWIYFRCQRRDFELLREIVPAPDGPLAGPLRLPPTMRLITIVGFPRRRHLSNGFMRRCHRFISPRGPNDGGVLLADACRLPGSLYPVWGADHYLRPEARARSLLAAVFAQLLATSSVTPDAAAIGSGR